jgi:diguanylate cyclase (GGDEF)-like protein
MPKEKKSEAPIIVFGILVYLILMFAQINVQRQGISYLNGLIAQVQNIVIVLMTVKAHKKGFIASTIIAIISSVQTLLMGVLMQKNMSSLPGVVIPIVMILMAYLIYSYSNKMRIANDELNEKNEELNQTNAALIAKDEKLMYLAYHDVLTGLANKQLLVDTMNEKITNQKDKPFTVLEANIDNLKEITDTYGINAEDEIVFSYAEKIKSACGNDNFIAYLNNGRFVILVENNQTQADILAIAKTINSIASEPIVIKDIAFKTTMSYGVASYPAHAQSTERLIQCANASVDYVIAHGGNNLYFYVDSKSIYLGR